MVINTTMKQLVNKNCLSLSLLLVLKVKKDVALELNYF
jgi:hypothetical protein